MVCQIDDNGLVLDAVADLGVQNRQYTTKVDARQNVELTNKNAIEPNACYLLFFFSVKMWITFYRINLKM